MTKSLERTWLSLVVRADPEYEQAKRRELEYEFSRRVKGEPRRFYADPNKRGAYAPS